MNFSKRRWTRCSLSIVATLAGWALQSGSLFGQVAAYSPFSAGSSASPLDDRSAKIELALDMARVAAEGEMFELSFEAVKRACAEGPPIAKPQIQSSLLGGSANTSTRVMSGRSGFEVPESTLKYRSKLFSIVDKWNAKKAPPENVVQALEQIVFPVSRPNEIMLFSNTPYTDSNSYSYEFSFAKTKPARYLAFELIELANKQKNLPSLIEKLEKMRTQPTAQAPAVAMLVYAKRVSGQTDAAAKTLEELVANPVAIEQVMPLYSALTQPVPEGGETSVVPIATSVPLLSKLLKQNVMRMDIRGAILQQLRQAIESSDQTAFDAYVAMVEESINQFPDSDQSMINYLFENFYRNLTAECERQGKTELALEVSTRAVDARTNLGADSVLSADTLISFADLKSDVRLKALRKMLVERPLVKFEQFSFAQNPQSENVPEFFNRAPNREKLKQFLPYEGAKSISLLDLLLNEAETAGTYQPLVKEMLANAKENEDVKRFLAVWLNFRNEKRGKPVDAELEKLANFENEKEYLDWWKAVPVPAAMELISVRMKKIPPTEVLRSALETKFSNQQPTQEVSEMRFQQRLAVDKSVISANRLKHWVVSYEPINWQDQDQPPFWSINEKKQAECFGGSWYCQLIFRYPMPLKSTIKVTTDLTEKKSDGLYCGGMSMMSYDDRQGACVFVASNVRSLGQFSMQTSKPTRSIEGIVNDGSLMLKVDDKTVEVRDYSASTIPFVGLASYGARPASFSDVAITSPTAIPREVTLFDEDLNGWSAYLFGHMLPTLSGRIAVDDSVVETNEAVQEGATPMWQFVDNELRAGKDDSEKDAAKSQTDSDEHEHEESGDEQVSGRATVARQSNLTYARPLCEGERFEYEFFHQPEVQNASPSLGRIAYLISDGKISLRWISIERQSRGTKEESKDLGDDPAAEILAPIKLEPNAWNRVQLRREGGKIVIAVAGTDVYRRPLEKDMVARFGFYCDPTKEKVRVRNAVLKGDWPTELPKDLWELN